MNERMNEGGGNAWQWAKPKALALVEEVEMVEVKAQAVVALPLTEVCSCSCVSLSIPLSLCRRTSCRCPVFGNVTAGCNLLLLLFFACVPAPASREEHKLVVDVEAVATESKT